MRTCLLTLAVMAVVGANTRAGVIQYGDRDLCNTGTYGAIDPVAGTTLEGLAANAVTFASNSFGHGFPFSPTATDYPGTDQIYVGETQTGFHDGYSGASSRLNGPQVVAMDYSSLIPAGETVQTLTLGIAADDFQRPAFGQPYTALINGVANAALTAVLNSLSQTGPVTQFFTIGIAPGALLGSNILTLSIDQGGDGGDGWAIDFLTVGVTTASAVPEPSTLAGLACGIVAGLAMLRRRVHVA